MNIEPSRKIYTLHFYPRLSSLDPQFVFPWFGGHLKLSAIMRMEVSHDKEEEIQAVQS